MTQESNQQAAIIRTERGLTIARTRITLYDVMDYLKAGYPRKFIRDIFNLSDEQIDAVFSYIEDHRVEVEEEYQEVLKMAEEIREYWQERNRDRFAQIAVASPRQGYEAVRVKLIEHRRRREASKK